MKVLFYENKNNCWRSLVWIKHASSNWIYHLPRFVFHFSRPAFCEVSHTINTIKLGKIQISFAENLSILIQLMEACQTLYTWNYKITRKYNLHHFLAHFLVHWIYSHKCNYIWIESTDPLVIFYMHFIRIFWKMFCYQYCSFSKCWLPIV